MKPKTDILGLPRLARAPQGEGPVSACVFDHGPARSLDEWIEPNHTVQVQGYAIDSGMFYEGDGRPFSIDPRLPVGPPDFSPVFVWGAELSYRALYPGQRGAYLKWLASGRKEPTQVPLAFLQLFFMGLEYRLFLDHDYDPELVVAAAEVLSLYRKEVRELPLISWLLFWDYLNGWEPECVVLDWLLSRGFRLESNQEITLALGSLAQAGRNLTGQLAIDAVWCALQRGSGRRSYSLTPGLKPQFLATLEERFPRGFPLKQPQVTTPVGYTPQSLDLCRDVRLSGGPLLLTWDVPDPWAPNNGLRDLAQLWNELEREARAPKLQIDPARKQALDDDTKAVQEMVGTRLEDSPDNSQPPFGSNSHTHSVTAHPDAGLDAHHLALVHQLVTRPHWTKRELEALARKHLLMPWALVHEANRWSLEAFQDRLLFGEDPISVNQTLITKIPKIC